MIDTMWGQSGIYRSQAKTPTNKNGDHTYPGCTTIAVAQILYYYQYQNQATVIIDYLQDYKDLYQDGVLNREIYIDLFQYNYNFENMMPDLNNANQSQVDETTLFLYHVAATMQAQFGLDAGSSATGKHIENAFRYMWGFNNISRRKMSIIAKNAFGYDDQEWVEVIKSELDAGRPVLYMANQDTNPNAGHAYIIDGYNSKGLFHINWGWGGYGNGYFDPISMEDPAGRHWNREPMIFRGLEPKEGFALNMLPDQSNPDETIVEESSSVEKGEWVHYGPFDYQSHDSIAFSVELTGTGDADVYIKKGGKPTSENTDICLEEEGSEEKCTLTDEGLYYISVYGYEKSDYQLTVKYFARDGKPSPSLEGIDLVVEKITINKLVINLDETIRIYVEIKNGGTDASQSSKLKYYLSRDDVYDSGDKYLNIDSVDALEAGEVTVEYANKKITSKVVDPLGGIGDYFILAVADCDGVIHETNEENNIKSIAITVK